ncbi:MAG: hypothetical protein HDR27_09905 [Lachnospiraceae bacterium]|nr:hypothetical protein [Lachnospiraceae bacterium]
MCYSKEIYGMPYKFYGFEGVEAYLPAPGGKIAELNPELDSWFRYFQNLIITRKVEEVLVVNPYVESAKKIVTDRKNIYEIEMLDAMIAQRSSNPILGQQANNIILMDYDKVIEKAESMGREVFFSVLLHESTHLLEQYLADNFGIYNKLESDKRDAYREAVLILEKEGAEFDYLNEAAEYQRNYIEEEALTCLVDVLTFYQLKAANPAIIGELQQKLNKAIEIAQNGRGLPTL